MHEILQISIALTDAYSGMINNIIRLKGNPNIKMVCIDVRIEPKLILFHLFLFCSKMIHLVPS